MLLLLSLVLLSYIPCAISASIGGTFWVTKINLGFVAFDYGAVPLFLTIAWLVCAPLALYIKADLAKYRAEEAKKLAALLDQKRRDLDSLKDHLREESERRDRKFDELKKEWRDFIKGK